MVIDYKTEVNKLEQHKPGDSSDYWKPTAGQYQVKALSEMEDAPPYVDDEGKENPMASINIQVNDKEIVWSFGIGKTMASTYGQLCNLGKQKGKLKDEKFTVVVTSDGNKNRYTIVI